MSLTLEFQQALFRNLNSIATQNRDTWDIPYLLNNLLIDFENDEFYVDVSEMTPEGADELYQFLHDVPRTEENFPNDMETAVECMTMIAEELIRVHGPACTAVLGPLYRYHYVCEFEDDQDENEHALLWDKHLEAFPVF